SPPRRRPPRQRPGQHTPSSQQAPPSGPNGTPPGMGTTAPSTGPPGPPVHCETTGPPQTLPGVTTGLGAGAVSGCFGVVLLSAGPTGMGWAGVSCDLARTSGCVGSAGAGLKATGVSPALSVPAPRATGRR